MIAKQKSHGKARTGDATLLYPLLPRQRRPMPALCAPTAHAFCFESRVQLGLVGEAAPGAYPMAVYLACTRCVACVEFLGACDPVQGWSTLESAWLLLPDGRGWALPVPAGGGVQIAAHGVH